MCLAALEQRKQRKQEDVTVLAVCLIDKEVYTTPLSHHQPLLRGTPAWSQFEDVSFVLTDLIKVCLHAEERNKKTT